MNGREIIVRTTDPIVVSPSRPQLAATNRRLLITVSLAALFLGSFPPV